MPYHLATVPEKYGAGDEARTRYLHLGKVALYRMSYTRIWCLRSELLFCGKATAVAICHRHIAKSRLSTPNGSCVEKWCLRSELNQRHADFQSAALPTELQRHVEPRNSRLRCVFMATRNGLEPSTSSVTGWRANRLHHRARLWWEQQGSNL